MKICKARITQCSGRGYWYKNRVGQEVFAIRQPGESDLGFRMIFVGAFDDLPSNSYFNANDLEVIEEFDGHIVERVTVEVMRIVGADNTALVGSNVAIEGPEQAQLANGPARMEGSTP